MPCGGEGAGAGFPAWGELHEHADVVSLRGRLRNSPEEARYLFTPGVTHAPGREGILPALRLRGQAAFAPRSNVNAYEARARPSALRLER